MDKDIEAIFKGTATPTKDEALWALRRVKASLPKTMGEKDVGNLIDIETIKRFIEGQQNQ